MGRRRERSGTAGGDTGHPTGVERVLLVGATALTAAVAGGLAGGRARVVGVVVDGESTAEVGAAALGPVERLDKVIQATRPDRIVVDLAARAPDGLAASLVEALAAGIAVEDAAEAYERLTGQVPLEALRPEHVMFSKGFPAGRVQGVVARGLSLLAASVGLIGLAPLLAALAVAIKLDSPGPVLFVQRRLGRGGRPFPLVKFRTMRPGPPRSEWVRDNGDRITRVGGWLRRFRLDELPQLVNVLRGEMNLVGPRPHPVSNAALFAAGIPFYPLRLLVRPGVTGWAQVRYGYANDLREEIEKMRWDLYYIKHRSVALDLRILALTLKVVLFGSGVEAPRARADRPDWQAAA